MSFSALFEFDGGREEGYDVLLCQYSFEQATDTEGAPASAVYGGYILVEIVSDHDEALVGWMIDPYKTAGGSITFKKLDEDATLKQIQFEEGYCVQYTDQFDASDDEVMSTMILISARKLTIGEIVFEAY